MISVPLKLKSEGIRSLVKEALYAQGVRGRLTVGQRRHEFQTDHGFRKWFKTRCEMSGMKPIHVEILMNHSCGISDSYYRATENELLLDFLNAVDHLTIESEQKMKLEIDLIKEKSNETESAMHNALKDKEKRIDALENKIDELIQSDKELREFLKYPAKLMELAKDT